MTAYSSTLNLRMKDLYNNNYYTPQLPMRTFQNPYFLPTSNQLLFDILKKQSATKTPTMSSPPTPSTARSSSVPPSTTGPRRRTGPGRETTPAPKATKPKTNLVPTAAQIAAAAAAKKIQDKFNKDTPQLRKDIAARKAADDKAAAADKAKDKAAAAAKGGKTKAGGGKIAAKVFSPAPTFTPNESLDSKLSKMENWKKSQPPNTQITTTDKQSADLMLGFKILKDLKKEKADKQLSAKGKGAASKPIEKAGKQGDTTKLTDATAAATKPKFGANNIPSRTALAVSHSNLSANQLTRLTELYKSWKADSEKIANAQSENPRMRMSVREKGKFIVKKQNAITRIKKEIVALENKGR